MKKPTKQKELVATAYKLGKKHGYQKGYRAGKRKSVFPTFEESYSLIREFAMRGRI